MSHSKWALRIRCSHLRHFAATSSERRCARLVFVISKADRERATNLNIWPFCLLYRRRKNILHDAVSLVTVSTLNAVTFLLLTQIRLIEKSRASISLGRYIYTRNTNMVSVFWVHIVFDVRNWSYNIGTTFLCICMIIDWTLMITPYSQQPISFCSPFRVDSFPHLETAQSAIL